jgi:methylated-DNA-[protein]-cysteine S-methyltransferase
VADVAATVLASPLGTLSIEATETGLKRVRLPREDARVPEGTRDGDAAANASRVAEQLEEYFRGEREEFDVELDWTGVDAVHRRVLETLCEAAPYGTTVTYGELGRRAGVDDPRDVGVMMARNPIPLVVPCHRVVASDGLGGYGGGLELKQWLLELEGVLPARLDLGV